FNRLKSITKSRKHSMGIEYRHSLVEYLFRKEMTTLPSVEELSALNSVTLTGRFCFSSCRFTTNNIGSPNGNTYLPIVAILFPDTLWLSIGGIGLGGNPRQLCESGCFACHFTD
ncbi:MAG: hypothetical protein WAL14_04460, partial [Pseudolabrys sp.]